MNPWIKVLLAATGVAIVVIVITAMQRASEDAAWTHLDMARSSENPVEALETALVEAKGTVAEPWISYYLAMGLYDSGEPDDLQRARQIAVEATNEHPEHATAPYLRDLVSAIDSYEP